MKVAELREKAKEFEIETTGKKKPSSSRRSTLPPQRPRVSAISRAFCRFAQTAPASSTPMAT